MPSKQDFEKCNIIQLAVFCGQIADNYPDEKIAEQAFRLKREWIQLVGSQPALTFKEQSGIEAALQKLHGRMAEFLTMYQ